LASSITTSVPAWLTGCTYDGNSGNDLRNSFVTAMMYDSGVAGGGSTIGVQGGVIGGNGLAVSAGTGMTVNVSPGSFAVPHSAALTAGGYMSTLASSGTLTVAAADPSNPRLDAVVAYVSDVGTSASFGAIAIITGTAAASPLLPAVPLNSTILASVLVPAGATSIVSGDVSDTRVYTVAAGGVLIATTGSGQQGYAGQLAYDRAKGIFWHNTPSGSKQAKVLPFTPNHQVIAPGTSISNGAVAALASASVTCDGNTDLKMTLRVGGITQASGASTGDQLGVFEFTIDGTVIARHDVPLRLLGSGNECGSVFTMEYTSAARSTTPSAGTHTVAVYAAVPIGGGNTFAVTYASFMRVEPVNL
jgi:hypothetical protein